MRNKIKNIKFKESLLNQLNIILEYIGCEFI